MIYTSYDPKTGVITGTCVSSNAKDLVKSGLTVVAGQYDSSTQYIKNGKAQDYPAKPYTGYWISYNWDGNNWSVNTQLSSANARAVRNDLLSSVDKVNAIWYSKMTPDDQAAVSAYRQALLNVPQQSGFPISIIWPIKPAWL